MAHQGAVGGAGGSIGRSTSPRNDRRRDNNAMGPQGARGVARLHR